MCVLFEGEDLDLESLEVEGAGEVALGLARVLGPPGVAVAVAEVGEAVLALVRVAADGEVVAAAEGGPVLRVVVDGALRLLAPHHQRLVVLGILLGANQRECCRNCKLVRFRGNKTKLIESNIILLYFDSVIINEFYK